MIGIFQVNKEYLKTPGSETAHGLLHTGYSPKKRIQNTDVKILGAEGALPITLCFGTSCLIRGAQKIMDQLSTYVKKNRLEDKVIIKATFCHERCQKGPVVSVGEVMIEKATTEKVIEAVEKALQLIGDAV